jgi:antitoxin component YwqK of YwqJK toxin-antitoxin module
MFSFIEFGFSQIVHLQKDLIKKENLWYFGEELYTGEVITLSQDQIETRYSVEKGVPTGWFTKYFKDNTFKKSNYKDTAEIRRLNQEMVSENNTLNSFIKDSLEAYNDHISYINNAIGGEKNLQKLIEKKQANKLREKQKELMDDFVTKEMAWKNSVKNVLFSQKKIDSTNTKLKEEEAKPVVAPKIAEQYEQVDSIKNGSYKSYFEDGALKSEGTFLKGLYNGAWTFYHSNGKVHAKGSYVMGKPDVPETSGLPCNGRDGLWKIYHDNGKLSQESNFLKGKRDGSFKSYNTVGVLTEEALYKNDVLKEILKNSSECLNKVLGVKTALFRIRAVNPALADEIESIATMRIDATNAATYRQDFRDLADLLRTSGLDMNDASNKLILEALECKADMADELSKTEMEKPDKCKCCICIEKNGCFSFKRR